MGVKDSEMPVAVMVMDAYLSSDLALREVAEMRNRPCVRTALDSLGPPSLRKVPLSVLDKAPHG